MNREKNILPSSLLPASLFVFRAREKLWQAFYASRFILLLLLPVLFSGCQFNTVTPPLPDFYYQNSNKDLSSVGRTALVELNNYSAYPKASTDVTQALFQALQKKQRFGLAVVDRSEPAWRSLQAEINSAPQVKSVQGQPAYTRDELIAIRKTLKCDAVLVGTITQFRPHPHMAVGLRLKLVDLRDGQLLWALEQIWDTSDKTTENRIKIYFQYQKRSGYAPLREQLAVVSPLEFMKFVAYEVAETL